MFLDNLTPEVFEELLPRTEKVFKIIEPTKRLKTIASPIFGKKFILQRIKTIHPNGTFFTYWELAKCIIIVIQMIIIYFSFNLLFPYSVSIFIAFNSIFF